MKILVVNTSNPFTHGGAEELASNLVSQLNGVKGVAAELLRLPFTYDPPGRVMVEILLHRQLRLANADRVIALKFPSYLIPHEHKTLWVLHQFRQAYDLGEQEPWASGTDADATKAAVRLADERCFDAARQVFVNSPTTRERMRRFNGREPTVLYPPLNDPDLFCGGAYGDYIFAGGRVAASKRQHLLVEALARCSAPVRLLIAGPPENVAYATKLRRLVKTLGLEDRVTLKLGLHSRAEVAGFVNGALACAYIPFDEDSLGYVTMEAFAAGKAVLTTADSGGLLEIVGADTGIVAEPTAEALAAGCEAFWCDRPRAAALGASARRALAARGLNWTDTLAALLDGSAAR